MAKCISLNLKQNALRGPDILSPSFFWQTKSFDRPFLFVMAYDLNTTYILPVVRFNSYQQEATNCGDNSETLSSSIEQQVLVMNLVKTCTS